MDKNYRHEKTSVSMLHYHIVFCPRYRRKIFLVEGVEQRFKELTAEICEKEDIRILAMECAQDHVHLFLSCPPKLSPSDVIGRIKGYTGRALRQEFSQFSRMPSLWTRSFFVSTAGQVSSETIQQYVENQKKKYK